jgi:hypothetical protein
MPREYKQYTTPRHRTLLERSGVRSVDVESILEHLYELAIARGIPANKLSKYMANEAQNLFVMHSDVSLTKAADELNRHLFGGSKRYAGVDIEETQIPAMVTIEGENTTGKLPARGSQVKVLFKPSSKNPITPLNGAGTYLPSRDLKGPVELTLLQTEADGERFNRARIRFQNGHELYLARNRLPSTVANLL